ncbi:hypothetical protein M407DRAFT_246705 [Tulasnella calospora MUT 4182]|uniref:Ubiquitin-like domain-containing protein n=1 Tax=Tulasnella calospora MUT 4182 TaxID=1051891 RepID=A0A0C3Q470_9AGAM|nr:hypothetical protein M407DRAFT_246705 [Tulasnella calospora MUT 4182]
MTIRDLKRIVFQSTGLPIAMLRSRDIIYWNDNATLDDYAIDEWTEVIILTGVRNPYRY